MVIALLEAAILLHRGGIGEMYLVACLHEAINEPVPVVRRFHHSPRDLPGMRRQCLQNRGQIIG